MLLLTIFLLIANGLMAFCCYNIAWQKGYNKNVFLALGLVPYFNVVVLVYLLFLPDLKLEEHLQPPNAGFRNKN